MGVDLSIRVGLDEVEVKWRRRRGNACAQKIAGSERSASSLHDPRAIGSALSAALLQTKPRRIYLAPHIRVALADPYLRVAVLRFAQLPRSRADRKLLVTQRFCHDHNLRPAETAVCFDEWRAKGGEPQSVVASATEAALPGEISGSLARHGLYADVIAPESAFAVRYLRRWLSPPPRILLLIYPDYAAISIWTEDAAPRHGATLRVEALDGDGFAAKVMRRLQRYLSAETGGSDFALDVLDLTQNSSLSNAVLHGLASLSNRTRDLRTQMPHVKMARDDADLTRDLIMGGA